MKKSFTRLTALLLALVLVCTLLPFGALRASAAAYSGSCGSGVTWTLDTGTGVLEIKGSGAMTDYYSQNAPWYDYRASIKTVKVGSGVTTLGRFALYYCESLTSVTLPSSLTSIGDFAFAGCKTLPSITLPSGLKSIGSSTFLNCSALTSLTIPASLTTIGTQAFEKCESLTKFTVASGSKSFSTDSSGVLFNADKTKLVQYPTGRFGDYEIPSTVTAIGDYAFATSAVTGITIPKSVTTLGIPPFMECHNLEYIEVNSANTKFCSDSRGVLFDKNKTILYAAPGTIMESYTVPSGVKTIYDSAFEDCWNLTEVSLPSSVTKICFAAFRHCYYLTEVPLNNNITEIGAYAFAHCFALWNLNVIPNKLTVIEDGTFVDCRALKSISIPATVTEIKSDAFASCDGLRTVTIPGTVKSIGSGAFAHCHNMTTAKICYGVNTVGYNAFYQCPELFTVTVAESVTNIGSRAFGYLYNDELNDMNICGISGSAAETYAESNDFSFISLPRPTITTQPKSVTAVQGATATFSVAGSTDNPPLGYQWQYKKAGETSWSYWGGKTSATASCTVGTANNGCQYRCIVNDSVGIIKSNVVTLTMITAPTITSQPKNTAVAQGSTATFKVTASGGNLSYQWQYKKVGESSWTNWSGKTSATVTCTAGVSNDGCQYRCVVKNAAGSVTSSIAKLTTVFNAPKITTQPKDTSVVRGKTATFKVVATGEALSYQWQYKKVGESGWTNWSGKTAATVTCTAGTSNNGCQYRCVVKNAKGSVTSSIAKLTTVDPPAITTQPKNTAVAQGSTATFKVVASGVGLSYQWQYKKVGESSWTNWSGKTSATVTCTAGTSNDGCQYRCVVKNAAGSVTSSIAKLTTVFNAPKITTQPKNTSVNKGSTATFKVVATGEALSYQWQYKKVGESGWTNWSGKTSATVTCTAGVSNNGCQYRCVVKNAKGSVTSSIAVLTTIMP